jgi:hypothetical protein
LNYPFFIPKHFYLFMDNEYNQPVSGSGSRPFHDKCKNALSDVLNASRVTVVIYFP